ncbi:MAG: hypothetical protein AAFR94_09230 [Pseudomonadota bacterium]
MASMVEADTEGLSGPGDRLSALDAPQRCRWVVRLVLPVPGARYNAFQAPLAQIGDPAPVQHQTG